MSPDHVIPLSYYQQEDALALCRDLLGTRLYSFIDHTLTGGIITEVEGYLAPEDKASHAYGMRRTKRNEVMYKLGGIAYVYFCYGMHYMLNIVTNTEDKPHAILIRAIVPLIGLESILKRRCKEKFTNDITLGPGNVAKALNISMQHNGISLDCAPLWLEKKLCPVYEEEIEQLPRVGIDYAGEWAQMPWRFRLSKEAIKRLTIAAQEHKRNLT